MKNRLKWVDGFCFLGETASGHTLVMDGSIEYGGQNRGARPLELLLHGTAGCMAYNMIAILKKERQDIRDGWIDIEAEQAPTPPKVYTKIHFHLVLVGKQISEAAVERALKLTNEKYCSASIMMSQAAEIICSYELREAE